MSRLMNAARALATAALAGLLALAMYPGEALGTKYDTSPRDALLLRDSERLLVQHSSDGLALYRAGVPDPLATFPVGHEVNCFDLTADESTLVVACADGAVSGWDAATGARLWERSGADGMSGYATDAVFARDGNTCVVGDMRGTAAVFEARTGRRVGGVAFPPNQTDVMSACLSPDGTRGILIELGGRLHAFDPAGRLEDTGVEGAWPVRLSSDGRHAAFRSSNSGAGEQLAVMEADRPWKAERVGRFRHIGHIRPDDAGGFLVTAGESSDFAGEVAGSHYRPGGGGVKELWRLPVGRANRRTDFRPDSMRGVCTAFNLVTTLTDLKTGAAVWSVDNSANYRPRLLSWSSRGLFGLAWPGLGLVAVGGLAVGCVWLSGRRPLSHNLGKVGVPCPRSHLTPTGKAARPLPSPTASWPASSTPQSSRSSRSCAARGSPCAPSPASWTGAGSGRAGSACLDSWGWGRTASAWATRSSSAGAPRRSAACWPAPHRPEGRGAARSPGPAGRCRGTDRATPNPAGPAYHSRNAPLTPRATTIGRRWAQMGAGHGEKRSRKQEQALAALLTEPTVEAAAASGGVGLNTLRRWLAEPEFRSAYRAARRQLVEGVVARLQRSCDRAAEALEGCLAGPRHADRIRAATAIIDRAVKGVELLDVLERLDALERAAAEKGRP
jgi:hypothetical protein